MHKQINILSDEIKRQVLSTCKPERIFLFGSYIYGTPNNDSDLDLMIVMNTHIPKHKRATDIRLQLADLKLPIDILVYTPEEVLYWNGVKNHIITEILNKGVMIYEKRN